MAIPAERRLLTIEDLYSLPDDGLAHELQAGVLISEPLPGFRHGRIAMRIAALLDRHVHAAGLGVVLSNDTGFVLARSPDTVRGPDVCFVRRGRYEDLEDPAKAFPGPPDLAVEVLSPNSTAAGIHAKVADYLAAGTRLVWVLDPETETVAVYGALLRPRILGSEDRLEGEDVVPGFGVTVAGIFEP
jgi:Uma2 family endonuclease